MFVKYFGAAIMKTAAREKQGLCMGFQSSSVQRHVEPSPYVNAAKNVLIHWALTQLS